MSGFEVPWPKPNLAYNWMVKNGLFPLFSGPDQGILGLKFPACQGPEISKLWAKQ
jgi:hypothetical protein